MNKKTKNIIMLIIGSILFQSSMSFYNNSNVSEKEKLQKVLKQNKPQIKISGTNVKVSEDVNNKHNIVVDNVTVDKVTDKTTDNMADTDTKNPVVPLKSHTENYENYDLNTYDTRYEAPKVKTKKQTKNNNNITSNLSNDKYYKLISYIKTQNKRLTTEEINYILYWVFKYSKDYEMNPYFVLAVINTESHFQHSTVSSAGAMGLMQLMDFNIREFGVDNSIKGNIKGGIMHLARDYYNHNKNYIKTLVCYNAGCSRLKNDKWKQIKETREYVPKVKKYLDRILSL